MKRTVVVLLALVLVAPALVFAQAYPANGTMIVTGLAGFHWAFAVAASESAAASSIVLSIGCFMAFLPWLSLA